MRNENLQIQDNFEPLLVVEYSFGGRILALLFRVIGLLFGLIMILASNIFFNIFGILIVILFLKEFFSILFFKVLIFKENKLLIIWNLGFGDYKKIFLYKELWIILGIRVYGGNHLTFVTSKKRWQIPFSIDLLPISKKDFINIKEIINKKNINTGDGYEWNN